jgi:hypothetical protein
VRLSLLKYSVAIAGVLAIPVAMRIEHPASSQGVPQPSAVTKPLDPRTVRLHQFFTKLRCPIRDLADDFVRAADDNNLDWRLLPSISIIESGGGKAFKNNNVLGWGNGDLEFPTIRAGIHQVAFRLGRSSLYRNKSVTGKLHVYNPNEDYAPKVEAVMRRISPLPNLKLVAYSRPHRPDQPLFISQDD